MFFAALTSASNSVPQLVQTKRDRLMRLAPSIAWQALHVCDVWAGSTTTTFEPYHWPPAADRPAEELFLGGVGVDPDAVGLRQRISDACTPEVE